MSKPRHTVRLPPSAADAFVALGEAPGKTPMPPGIGVPVNPVEQAQKAGTKRKVQTRADGRIMRKQTLYLEADLSRRLAMYCAETGVDLSAAVAEALELLLARR